MPTLANTTATSAFIEKIVGRMVTDRVDMAIKNASQQSPSSVTNMEESAPEQYVTSKLQHKGENYDKAGLTSYGLQMSRDLVAQGVNVGPIPDKASSDQPDDRSSLNDIKNNPLYDVFDPVGEPTEKVTDPGTQGDAVSEKLQLKKDASALLTRMDDVNRQGQKIIDYMMQLTVEKQASVQPPLYTQEELLTESTKLATVDAIQQVKAAMLHAVDDAIYAAEATALELRKAADADVAPKLAPLPPAKSKQASGEEIPPEETAAPAPAPLPQSDVGGEQAMAAMNAPMPEGGELGGEPPISEEDAQALMAQSLAANGIDPNMAASEQGPAPGGEPGSESDSESVEITPEELAMFQQAMQQAGVTPDEVAQALQQLEAEQGAGITPDAGAIADEEAAKTGHYKFASFIKRPALKTAEQEQRAAMIRGAVRDFIFGPSTKNFN